MLGHEITSVEANLADLHIGLTKAALDPAPGVPTPLTVTITELSTPQLSPPTIDDTPEPALQPMSKTAPDSAPGTFHYFPYLPAELRLKIWRFSFLPRTVELHTRRTHYADDDRFGAPRWQSLSRNPAALSVNAEARAAALEFYTVALPLCDPVDLPLRRTDRLLYINPEEDTVALLGDLHFARLTKLLDWFREQDVAYHSGRSSRAMADRGKGLRRLAMSVAQWAHEVGARTLRAFARNVFADVEEFVLFMYENRIPPGMWTGGRCVLEDTRPEDEPYRRFAAVWGKAFRNGDSWMTVGKRPLKIVDISFLEGW